MAVTFAQIEQTNTTGNFPTTAANTYTVGINSQGGAVEYLVCRYDITFGADPCSGDFTNLIDSLRVIINGEVVHDFRAGYASATSEKAGKYGYFLNKIGGRSYEEVGGGVTRTGYMGIPIGRVLPQGVNRIEIVLGFAATAVLATPTSGSLSWWLKFNTGFQKTTTIVPSTSFNHAIGIEQVVVRVPQNIQGVVSAILVQNQQAADELGSQGVRIQALGAYGLEASMWRWLNGDMLNGIMFADPTQTTHQKFLTEVEGAMLLPCFGLAGGDIVLQVDSSATTTRTYTPIITAPVGAKEVPQVRQTQRVSSSTAGTIVAQTEN